MLTQDDLTLELTIFERGVPPEFRVYAYRKGARIAPSTLQVSIDLYRFGGRIDHFRLAPVEDYLRSDREVEEPHSFEVEVTATDGGRTRQWKYESYEGRTEISPTAMANAGIALDTVGPATIRSRVKAGGRIAPNGDRLAHYVPRYPGLVKEVRKRLGETVAAGEALAVIEANDSLQSYEVKATLDGIVIAKDVTPGEITSDSRAIYAVADLSNVWVDLHVSREDFALLRVGQTAAVEMVSGDTKAVGSVAYLSPFSAEETQLLLARIEIANPDGKWRPGLFVTGEVIVAEDEVPLAVKTSALQTFRDWDVVYLNEGAVFQAIPVELGRRDREWAEVLGGLKVGERYVADGSFVVKADVEKSGATHDH
jgi:cobalt-zinc-cadmium efflux system membrane fusion protein